MPEGPAADFGWAFCLPPPVDNEGFKLYRGSGRGDPLSLEGQWV